MLDVPHPVHTYGTLAWTLYGSGRGRWHATRHIKIGRTWCVNSRPRNVPALHAVGGYMACSQFVATQACATLAESCGMCRSWISMYTCLGTGRCGISFALSCALDVSLSTYIVFFLLLYLEFYLRSDGLCFPPVEASWLAVYTGPWTQQPLLTVWGRGSRQVQRGNTTVWARYSWVLRNVQIGCAPNGEILIHVFFS